MIALCACQAVAGSEASSSSESEEDTPTARPSKLPRGSAQVPEEDREEARRRAQETRMRRNRLARLAQSRKQGRRSTDRLQHDSGSEEEEEVQKDHDASFPSEAGEAMMFTPAKPSQESSTGTHLRTPSSTQRRRRLANLMDLRDSESEDDTVIASARPNSGAVLRHLKSKKPLLDDSSGESDREGEGEGKGYTEKAEEAGRQEDEKEKAQPRIKAANSIQLGPTQSASQPTSGKANPTKRAMVESDESGSETEISTFSLSPSKRPRVSEDQEPEEGAGIPAGTGELSLSLSDPVPMQAEDSEATTARYVANRLSIPFWPMARTCECSQCTNLSGQCCGSSSGRHCPEADL